MKSSFPRSGNRFAAAALAAVIAGAAFSAPMVKEGDRIGFLGDSITQFGNGPSGYVNLVMKGLRICGVKAEKVPAGISGNKSNNMLARLERDVLSKNVTWMTLSCGVNDVWHRERGVELEEYKKNIS
jgi:lysophospholipase L1-like esterase